eukprot:TRINITY_DN2632_c0_g2_i1.p1 TRINITY_DN2632_c0_g2~~TRINITY_DN2632_c0_g2_i1.p1  ORF type:complete len:313 (+),score=94.87 TRINITY_DN2632_c0_g2_i1:48-941(+)
MPFYDLSNVLVVAVSSRALYDLEEEHRYYEAQGEEKYRERQMELRDRPFKPGVAFNLVRKLLRLNKNEKLVDVVILSQNSVESGVRVRKTMEIDELEVDRSVWSSGRDVGKYLKAFKVDLFLSADGESVNTAVREQNIPAAKIIPKKALPVNDDSQLRIAFDGDGVIFSSQSDEIYNREGLNAVREYEKLNRQNELPTGPLAKFLFRMSKIQAFFKQNQQPCPITTALITARDKHMTDRVLATFQAWDVAVDEALFLGNLDKSDFVLAFDADIFFDDKPENLHHSSVQGACVPLLNP